jgi:hypothetical protein
MRIKITVAAALAAVCLVGPVANAQAAGNLDSNWSQQNAAKAPKAKAACPFCVPIAIAAIRTAAVRAAPVAIRAVSRIGGTTARTRARVKAGSKAGLRWAKKAKRVTIAKALYWFNRMPKYVKGCGRGFVDHIRDYGDISLVRAFYACGRGIVEIYLGKNPLGPIEK